MYWRCRKDWVRARDADTASAGGGAGKKEREGEGRQRETSITKSEEAVLRLGMLLTGDMTGQEEDASART